MGAKRFPKRDSFKMGGCSNPNDEYNRHEKRNEHGELVPGACPGQVLQTVTSKLWDRGDTAYCQCTCHGKDRPMAWRKTVKDDAQTPETDTEEESESGNPPASETPTKKRSKKEKVPA